MKINFLIICILLLFSCSSNYKDKVRIQLDKRIILIGETVTARLYVNHNDSIAPIFNIIDNLDTVRIPIDSNDNDCGVFRAAYQTTGNKVFNGFVDFLDKQSKQQTYYYSIKFIVEALPTIPPNLH